MRKRQGIGDLPLVTDGWSTDSVLGKFVVVLSDRRIMGTVTSVTEDKVMIRRWGTGNYYKARKEDVIPVHGMDVDGEGLGAGEGRGVNESAIPSVRGGESIGATASPVAPPSRSHTRDDISCGTGDAVVLGKAPVKQKIVNEALDDDVGPSDDEAPVGMRWRKNNRK